MKHFVRIPPADCWVHAKQKFDETLQTLFKENRQGPIAATGDGLHRLFQLEQSLMELTPGMGHIKRPELVSPVLDV